MGVANGPRTETPPSTTICWPVTRAEASESRSSAASAISPLFPVAAYRDLVRLRGASEPIDPRVRLAISQWPDGARGGAVSTAIVEHGIWRKSFYELRRSASTDGPVAVLCVAVPAAPMPSADGKAPPQLLAVPPTDRVTQLEF
jgi:hypothetical protein